MQPIGTTFHRAAWEKDFAERQKQLAIFARLAGKPSAPCVKLKHSASKQLTPAYQHQRRREYWEILAKRGMQAGIADIRAGRLKPASNAGMLRAEAVAYARRRAKLANAEGAHLLVVPDIYYQPPPLADLASQGRPDLARARPPHRSAVTSVYEMRQANLRKQAHIALKAEARRKREVKARQEKYDRKISLLRFVGSQRAKSKRRAEGRAMLVARGII